MVETFCSKYKCKVIMIKQNVSLAKFSCKTLFMALLICSSFSFGSTTDIEAISIIPKPTFLEERDGKFLLDGSTKIFVESEDGEIIRVVKEFIKKINFAKHYNLKLTKNNYADLAKEIRFLQSENQNYGKEGYLLDVSPRKINIEANTANGIFYAIQTLYQLMPYQLYSDDAIGSIELEIPCVNIIDKPRFGWRGNMLDPSRHFISKNYIKQNLDYLASLKMNVFHWHLTDDQGWRIEIKSLPKLTDVGSWRVDRNNEEWWGRLPQQMEEKSTYGGFYSQEDIKEIIEYAKERFITVIPEIDIPGHSQAAIASYPEISCDEKKYYVATGGVAKDNTYCPGKEITFDYTEKILSEIAELFPSEYIHIGGDECNKEAWQICADCQKRIEGNKLRDEHELQSYFIKRVEKIINSKGKKLIGWDEILEGGLAPNATVMSWRGEEGGIEAAKAGHDVVMTPNTYCYLDLKQGDPELEPEYGYSQLLLNTVYSYEPIPNELDEKEAKHVLGIQGNLWGESMQTPFDLNYMLFPRMFAISEVAWSLQENREFNDFTIRLEKAFKRLEAMKVNYATSAYNVSVATSINQEVVGIQIGLLTEIESDIRFTTDGTEPDLNSTLYENSFNIKETTLIKAKVFKNNKVFGTLTEKEIKIHKAAGKKVSILSPVSERYSNGEYGLTDCLRGREDFANGRWLGIEGDDFEAIIDLEEKTTLNSITTSFLHDTKPWIFLPKHIEMSISEDGKSYTKIMERDNSVELNKNGKYVKEIKCDANNLQTRFIKIKAKNIKECPDWHQGAGGKAWLFIDEIIVE